MHAIGNFGSQVSQSLRQQSLHSFQASVRPQSRLPVILLCPTNHGWQQSRCVGHSSTMGMAGCKRWWAIEVACKRLVAVGAVGQWKRVAAVGQPSHPMALALSSGTRRKMPKMNCRKTRRTRILADMYQHQRVRIIQNSSNQSISHNQGLGVVGAIRSVDPRDRSRGR